MRYSRVRKLNGANEWHLGHVGSQSGSFRWRRIASMAHSSDSNETAARRPVNRDSSDDASAIGSGSRLGDTDSSNRMMSNSDASDRSIPGSTSDSSVGASKPQRNAYLSRHPDSVVAQRDRIVPAGPE